MSLPPLTISKPETLAQRLTNIETETTQKATESNTKTEHTVNINGFKVTFSVTPTRKDGLYRLFYLNDKRVAKSRLPKLLLENKVSE